MTNNQVAKLVDRIENLEAEKAVIAGDVKLVYAEAKAAGFDVKALRAIIARRKKDADAVRELEDKMAEYMSALGDFAFTPLGEAMKKHVVPNDGMDIPASLKRPSTKKQPFNDFEDGPRHE